MSQYFEAVQTALAQLSLLAEDCMTTSASLADPCHEQVPQPLRSAMRYSLLLPGKRIRPVLLLASFHMVNDAWEEVLPYACGLEMIHAYSLVHDDLPALDNDDLRRGQPTNHRVFGENMAILAGDGLLNMAYETMLSAPYGMKHPQRALMAIQEIAIRAGVRGMIAGQTLDVMLEGQPPSASLVSYIHQHKTADLLTAPIVAGLTLAGATQEQISAGECYGQNMGLAFQMIDDLLDVQGDVAVIGKQTGMDEKRGKMTWPSVVGVEQTQKDASVCIQRAVDALRIFGEKSKFLRDLASQTLVRKM